MLADPVSTAETAPPVSGVGEPVQRPRGRTTRRFLVTWGACWLPMAGSWLVAGPGRCVARRGVVPVERRRDDRRGFCCHRLRAAATTSAARARDDGGRRGGRFRRPVPAAGRDAGAAAGHARPDGTEA